LSSIFNPRSNSEAPNLEGPLEVRSIFEPSGKLGHESKDGVKDLYAAMPINGTGTRPSSMTRIL
jgi:hypothetical protein